MCFQFTAYGYCASIGELSDNNDAVDVGFSGGVKGAAAGNEIELARNVGRLRE
jgi:hypothetical protein